MDIRTYPLNDETRASSITEPGTALHGNTGTYPAGMDGSGAGMPGNMGACCMCGSHPADIPFRNP